MIWAFVFFAAGAATLIYGIGIIRDARACASWPQAEGRVVSAATEVVAREKNQTTYAPSVTYTFSVAGREFNGTRVTLIPRNWPSAQVVQSVLARYPVGSKVVVYHDPTDPSKCVLSTATNGSEWAYAIGGALLAGAGLLFLKRN